MGILTGGIGAAVQGVASIVDQFVESPTEKNSAELKRRALDMQAQLAQLDIAKEEAKHSSIFVAGARPSGLWILNIMTGVIMGAGTYGVLTGHDVGQLWQVYFPFAPVHMTLLGARTYEKVKGVHRDSVRPKK